MDTQIHLGKTMPQAAHLPPVQNIPGYGVKPAGGFWTSSYLPGNLVSSDWERWALKEWPDRARLKRRWLLTPDPAAQVMEIATHEDYEELAATYPYTEGAGLGNYLDYEALAKEWDALRMICPDDLESPANAWDCESTVWFRWRFLSVDEL